MFKKRIGKLFIIFGLVVGIMLTFLVLPALAAEQVLGLKQAVGNHYETPLYLDLAAGQVINITQNCTDASGTGITYVHYFEVGAVPTEQHPEYNDSIYYARWDCVDGASVSYTAPVATQYQFIFHVHTNQYGCEGAESCPTMTGISYFNYYLKVTTETDNPPTPSVTAEPSAEPTSEVTSEPTQTPEPTGEVTAEPSPTDAPTAEPTSEITSEPTDEVTAEPSPTDAPTAEPTEQATAAPPQSTPKPLLPELARDSRLNFKMGDLTAVVYRNRDDKGASALVIYGVNANSQGYFLCTITTVDLTAVNNQANDQNVLIKSCGERVSVYLLTTGEVQVNITEANKVFVTVLDSLEAKTIKHSLLET